MAVQRRSPTLGPVVGMAVTGPLGAWLAARALAAGAAFPAGHGAVDAADLATAVSVALLWVGCVAAAWYFLTCAAVVMALLGRAAGTGAAGLERAVLRWGFPLLRRTLLSTVVAGASLSLSVGAAGAAPSADEAPLPQDLGWGVSTAATQPSVGAAIGAAILPLGGDGPARAEDGSAHTAPPTEGPGTPFPASEEPTAEAGATTSASRAGTDPASSSAAARASAPPAAAATTTTTTTTTTRNAVAARATTAAAQGRSTSEQRTTYLVRPGDSLWSIAESHLGPGAAHAEVAQAWPRWYAANRPDVGPDPHLIHPGQLLQIPDEEAS